jgi:hypothetical protein
MMRVKYLLVVLVGLTSVVASAQDYSTRPVNNCVYRGRADAAYQQCQQNYNNQLREYNSFNSTTTGARAPSPPNYTSCNRTDATTGAVSQDGTCRQQLDASYQQQLQSYNFIKQQEAAAAAQREEAARQLVASRQAAEEAERKAKDGQKRADRSQLLSTVSSVVAFGICYSCSPACSASCAVGAFMASMAGKAGTQSGSFATSAHQACTTGNAYGATQANCGPAPNPFNPTGFPNNTQPPLNTLVDPNGNCTASAELCNDLRNGLPPGTTLNDLAKGLNGFGGPKPLATMDKDGNVITKDGKKYAPGSLDDVSELKAAGLSADQAGALLAAANKSGAIGSDGAITGIDKGAGGLDSLAGLDGLGEDGSGGKSSVIGAGGNGEADGSEFDADKKRGLASAAEGLAKDFNGELIGVAGDDIFKMMNRRYVLKIKQDSFMAP